jgi:hypothetical protein
MSVIAPHRPRNGIGRAGRTGPRARARLDSVHVGDPRDAPAPALAGRWRWLGHPAFGAAVVVLALNDHVLKSRYPGWWTGKLSDVAGLAVAATVAAVPLGPRRGVVAAGAAFVALKAVPGVAEAARPLLGGVTLGDASDLVALAVLPPLAWLMLRAPRPARSRPATALLPLIGAVGAVLTATATSCAPKPAVTAIAVDADRIYALVDRGDDTSGWAVSEDGGQSWAATDPPPGDHPQPQRADPYSDDKSLGPSSACGGDGTCYRLRDQRIIERRVPGGDWTEDERLSDDQLHVISTGCPPRQEGVLTSIGVADRPDGGHAAVASLGADGVLVRGDDGTWEPRGAVIDVENNPPATTHP